MTDVRSLDPATDLARVAALYDEAADYWILADRVAPDLQKARDFFTDGPPGCDPAVSQRLGLFVEDRLSGVAELSFGFPRPGDGYLGLMLLAPRLRGQGWGRRFCDVIEERARLAGCPTLFLGVFEANPRARAFWTRAGFGPTGVSRFDPTTGHVGHRLSKPLVAPTTN